MLRKILLGLGVVTMGVLPGTVPTAEAASAAIAWQPCAGEPTVDCATVPIPVDWSRPHGPTVGMAVARLKAAKPAQRKGVLMVNPGGPGVSGVSDVYAIAHTPRYQALTDSFDIVGFDPRGVEASEGIVCDSSVLDEPVSLVPTTENDYKSLLARNARVAADCAKVNGPLFDHVDTVSVVRDMDLLRRQLGESKISYYGTSYGTLIGQQYLELYGQNLRAIVLDSNVDHSIGATRDVVTSSRAFEESFEDFAAWCQRTPTCSLHGQDVLALWDSLWAKATAGTLTDPSSGQPVWPEVLREEAFLTMYHPARSWFLLSDELKQLAAGTPAGAPAITKAAKPADLEVNSYQAIWCSDWSWPRIDDFAAVTRLRLKAEAVAPHMHLSPFFSDITSCLGWTGPVNNPQHQLRPQHAPPILMTNSVHDIATPYEWATNIATQLPTATLLTYDGTGHGDYGSSLCARDAIDKYLLTLRLPARGTHCAAEWPTTPPASTFGPDDLLPTAITR
jgi:pimeloyl-ACP methyl ester carboxylesterase